MFIPPLLAVLSTFTSLAVHAQTNCAGSGWTGQTTLNADAEYTLHYKIESDNLVIRLRAKTNGFLAFGLSEAGHMFGADIVTAAVVNGQARLEDRIAGWTATPFTPATVPVPKLDVCQHWTALCAVETDTFTDMILTRPLNTSDSEDRQVVNGENFVIFAWGSTDDINYHGSNRGAISVDFSSQSSVVFEPPADANGQIEILMNNYTMPSFETMYVLQKIDLGVDVKHIVAVEPVIHDADKAYVHHMLVHDCGDADGQYPLDKLAMNTPLNSIEHMNDGVPVSPLGGGVCQGLVFGWAVGGKGEAFPDIAGVKMGAGGARFVILEIHLDNPTSDTNKIITSGVRLRTATQMRQHNLGTLVLGNVNADFPLLPAGNARVHRESTCTEECTSGFLGPIHVVSDFPHMHSTGREIFSIKYGIDGSSTIISSKQYWQFAFQNHFALDLVINPNDTVSTHCIFDTSASATDVRFGAQSQDEMCMSFLFFYPKENAGFKCGATGDGKTQCGKVILNSTVANPQPDGFTETPEIVSIGNVPLTCARINSPQGSGALVGQTVSAAVLSLATVLGFITIMYV